jgi:O-antigen ligase
MEYCSKSRSRFRSVNTVKVAPEQRRFVEKFAVFLWICSLILTGTYLRARDQQSASLDWLALSRLLVFGMGSAIGGYLIVGKGLWRSGATGWMLRFIGAAGASVLFAQSHKIVLGYWILLVGSSLLTFGLVLSAKDDIELERLKRIWVFTVFAIVVKDALIAISTSGTEGLRDIGDVERLGAGVTNPGSLSIMAAMTFWCIIGRSESYGRWFRILACPICVFVVLESRTRMVMISFAAAAVAFIMLKVEKGESLAIRILPTATILGGFLFVALILGLEPVNAIVNWFNRGQSSTEISSVTGRDQIWAAALALTFEEPIRVIFGHGYGATRFYLNWKPESPHFYASHCHCIYLEHLFSTGLLGLLAFVGLFWTSTRWLRKHADLSAHFPPSFVRGAATIIVLFLVYSLIEVTPLGRTNPGTMLFLFYAAALDFTPRTLSPGKQPNLQSNGEPRAGLVHCCDFGTMD